MFVMKYINIYNDQVNYDDIIVVEFVERERESLERESGDTERERELHKMELFINRAIPSIYTELRGLEK